MRPLRQGLAARPDNEPVQHSGHLHGLRRQGGERPTLRHGEGGGAGCCPAGRLQLPRRWAVDAGHPLQHMHERGHRHGARPRSAPLSKAYNPVVWATFPGGHVEAGESITASTVCEIREETGLTVLNLRICGVVEWETIGKRTDGSPAEVTDNSKYIMFMFRISTFTGELKSSAEGRMEWMTLDEMRHGNLAPHMEEYIRVLLEDDVPQAYGISGCGVLKAISGE